jgi:hypothetical protein
MPDRAHPELGQIHHLAYVVEELEPAARRLHEQFGAGPFLYLDVVPVEDVTSRGEPGEFLHGSAFGMCNRVPVELMKIARIEPARADERFRGTPRLQHLAYAVPPATLEAVRADLEASGLPEYLSARFGDDVDFSYHDAGATLGHDLEIHADSEGLQGFFAMIREAAEGWDGTDLMRLPDLG